jgi:hypothetical protein
MNGAKTCIFNPDGVFDTHKYAKALKTNACDMNAQDCMLRNVTVARFRIVRTFCGAHF